MSSSDFSFTGDTVKLAQELYNPANGNPPPLHNLLKTLTKPAFWFACLAVTLLSMTPMETLSPDLFDGWDKAQHFLAFLALSGLGFIAFPLRPRLRIALGLFALGSAIEIIQGVLSWRQGDLFDLCADALGILAGILIFALARRGRVDRPE